MRTLGQTIQALRARLDISVKDLAKRACVPDTLISGLQSNTRVIGENNARKIGLALNLKGEVLEDFVFQALNSGATHKILKASQDYPAEIHNLIAAKLRAMGITPDIIANCTRGSAADASLVLKDGRMALGDVVVRLT